MSFCFLWQTDRGPHESGTLPLLVLLLLLLPLIYPKEERVQTTGRLSRMLEQGRSFFGSLIHGYHLTTAVIVIVLIQVEPKDDHRDGDSRVDKIDHLSVGTTFSTEIARRTRKVTVIVVQKISVIRLLIV